MNRNVTLALLFSLVVAIVGFLFATKGSENQNFSLTNEETVKSCRQKISTLVDESVEIEYPPVNSLEHPAINSTDGTATWDSWIEFKKPSTMKVSFQCKYSQSNTLIILMHITQ